MTPSGHSSDNDGRFVALCPINAPCQSIRDVTMGTQFRLPLMGQLQIPKSDQWQNGNLKMSDRSQILVMAADSRIISPVSGTMIGICVTLVGLVKIADQSGQNHVDEYAALAAISFLALALAAYLSIRYAQS